jgi:hypothetical protein
MDKIEASGILPQEKTMNPIRDNQNHFGYFFTLPEAPFTLPYSDAAF